MTPERTDPKKPGKPPEGTRRRRHSSSRRAFKIVLGSVVLFMVGAAAFRALYPRFKEYQGRKIAAEAALLLDAGRYPEAINSIKLANRMAPNEPEVIRARARYVSHFNSPESVGEWQVLQAIGKATTDDKIQLLEVAVGQRRLDVSAPLLTELAPLQATNIKVLRLGIRHLTDGGFLDRATGLARFAFSKDPLDVENQFILGDLLLRSTNSLQFEEGRGLMIEIARMRNKRQATAVNLLIRSGRLESNNVPELLALLDLDSANITNIVNSLALRWIGRPERRVDIVEDAVRRIGSETDPARLVPVCEWLLIRDPRALLTALTEEKAGSNGLLSTSRAEALAAVKDWEGLEDYLRRRDEVLPKFSLQLLRAQAAVARDHATEAENLFTAAADSASKNPEALLYAARAAEVSGLPDAAIKIWSRLAEFPSMTMSAAGEILRLARGRDRVDAEMAILARLSSNIPGDVRLAADRAEKEALVGVNLNAASAALERQLSAGDKERKFVTALALVRLRQGDAAAALTTFEQVPFEWDALTGRDRAVYVAILGANQQRETARRFARQIDVSTLKSQEKELVAPWL